MFDRVALIGIGLINSSIARLLKRDNLAGEIVINSRRQETLNRAMELGLAERAELDAATAVDGADFIVLGVPVGANATIAKAIGTSLKPGAIVSDVGSVKGAVISDVTPHLPNGVHLVPAHPVAGTEFSGPAAGFAELFENSWCILTPPEGCDTEALEKVTDFWRHAGSMVDVMDAEHHDKVLAIISHLHISSPITSLEQ